jgi:hypothetical protein
MKPHLLFHTVVSCSSWKVVVVLLPPCYRYGTGILARPDEPSHAALTVNSASGWDRLVSRPVFQHKSSLDNVVGEEGIYTGQTRYGKSCLLDRFAFLATCGAGRGCNRMVHLK